MTDLTFSQLPASYPLAVLSLQYISTLEDDWVRHEGADVDSKRVRQDVIDTAYCLLDRIENSNIFMPKVEPTVYGGVRFDWSTVILKNRSFDIILDVEPDGNQLSAAIMDWQKSPNIQTVALKLTGDQHHDTLVYDEILLWIKHQL